MTTKQQPKAAPPEHDRRAAALRENLRKRREQSRLREAQSSRDPNEQAQARAVKATDGDDKGM